MLNEWRQKKMEELTSRSDQAQYLGRNSFRPPCPFAELVCSTAPTAAAAHVSLRKYRREALDAHIQTPVRREVNPALRLAGDAVGRADLRAVENLCRSFPEDRFLFSVLSRENQHELCVYARKFNNTMHFGCW